MKVLVDTSIWSLALRRKAEDLNQRERSLSGIKTNAQFEQLRKTLRAFTDEPVGIKDRYRGS